MGNTATISNAEVREFNKNERCDSAASIKPRMPKITELKQNHKKLEKKPGLIFHEDVQDLSCKGTPRAPDSTATAATPQTDDEVFLLGLSKVSAVQANQHLARCIQALRTLKNPDSPAHKAGVGWLYNRAGHTVGPERLKWVEECCKEGYVDMVKELSVAYQNPDFLGVGDPTWTQNGNRFLSLKFIWNFMWNATDCSTPFCAEMEKKGILEIGLANLQRSDQTPGKYAATNDVTHYWVAMATTGVLHNVLRRHRTESKRKLRAAGLIETMQIYMASDAPLIKMVSSMILAYSVEESEMAMLETKDNIIGTMIAIIKQAMRSSNRRSLGFAVDEMVESLDALAKHDGNKQKMVKQEVISLYMTIISQKREDEILYAMKGLWTLTFVPESVSYIKSRHPAYANDLKPYIVNPSDRIAKAAAGAMFNIDGKLEEKGKEEKAKQREEEKKTKKYDGPHVMLSYDHQHKEVAFLMHMNLIDCNILIENLQIAHELNIRLRQAGYHTWLDAEQMHGSTLDAMFDAIQNSAAILLCFSERYYQSNNCRAEAEQAFKMDKEIVPVRTEKYNATGWLSMILGTRFYVNCHEKSDIDKQLPGIIKQLGEKGKIPQDIPGQIGGAQGVAKKPGGKPLNEWSKDEVKKWLVKNDLGAKCGSMNDFDGAGIAALRDMHKQSPSLFFDQAKSFLNITDLAVLLKLTQLWKDL